MAPELFDEGEDDLSKVDTWSAAIVLVNMLTGGKSLGSDTSESAVNDYFADESLCSLLKSMLKRDTSERIELS